ncbi:sensor histidine kinase [Bacteroides sp. UBA939]|uniref:sensor histidine kinase n=1 Tax=Bacteroides sp. UBA939 TaxID=1946092 RepID=UPI0025BE18E4|nr:ATP-binding protein [Bacteroides sp. UBA939]
MKQYSLIVVLHICLLAVFSVGVYVLFRAELLFSTIIAFLFLSGTGIHLYHIQIKQLQVIRRLTDSLRYNDMTQTFRPPYQNKLMTEMTAELSETLQIFRARLLEEEVKHQYYETLLNKVDTAVLVTDMSGRIQWMNRAAIAQLGQTPQLPPELLFLHSGETQVMRIHRHGATLEMAVSSTLFMARGIEQRLISLKNIHSVLERNEMEAWQKLIRVLTHEIMNSITPIISLSETLSERGIPVTLKNAVGEKEYAVMLQALQTIHRRSKGLLGFVENYRRLTRLPAPVRTTVPVRELFTDLQKLFPDETIHFELPPSDKTLNVDRAQIEQVLINLLKNAREATVRRETTACHETTDRHKATDHHETASPRFPETPKIEVKAIFAPKATSSPSSWRCTITVRDNGEGILPEVQDKIFVPFFTTKTVGSGIGLSLCKQIMNQHGGNISVHSEPGKGSCFTLQFS